MNKAAKAAYDRARYQERRAKRIAESGPLTGRNGWTVSHRMTGSREYKAWQAMRSRCNRPSDADFDRYGGRGITVCQAWNSSFETFLADLGLCPPGMTIERINNSLGYCKENCRWATRKEQTRNRRNTVIVEVSGQLMTLQEACDSHQAKYSTVHSRVFKHGWPLLLALTAPKGARRAEAGKPEQVAA